MRHTPFASTAILLVAAVSSSCGSSPVSPSSPPPGASGTAAATRPSTARGQTLDALTGAPVRSVTVSLEGGASATTDAQGIFELTAPGTGPCRVTVSGPGVVQRETDIRMRSAGTSVTLIPSRFDLAAFDRGFRGTGALRRWTAAPALVVVDAVLQFAGVDASTFTALDERLTAEERASLVADLAWGLPQVTGGTFAAFASVTAESPAPGASVNFFTREGKIVVARFRGLSQATGYWGYGRAASRDNQVVAGAILIDRDFDAAENPQRRSLRVHEMGHALGYAHLLARPSFMNPAATIEPNEFDRDATRIAFQRAPGNVSPDRDPDASRASQSSAGMTWGAITP